MTADDLILAELRGVTHRLDMLEQQIAKHFDPTDGVYSELMQRGLALEQRVALGEHSLSDLNSDIRELRRSHRAGVRWVAGLIAAVVTTSLGAVASNYVGGKHDQEVWQHVDRAERVRQGNGQLRPQVGSAAAP